MRASAGPDPDARWVDLALTEPPPSIVTASAAAHLPPRSATVRALGLLRRPALLGLLVPGLLLLACWFGLLAGEVRLPLVWHSGADGRPVLGASADPALRPLVGQPLHALRLADGRTRDAQGAIGPGASRWGPGAAAAPQGGSDPAQARLGPDNAAAPRWPLLDEQPLTLVFASGATLRVTPQPRGLAGLGLRCWLLGGLALALGLAAVLALRRAHGLPAPLYALLALAQGLNLLLLGADTLPGQRLDPAPLRLHPAWHLLADAVAAAALLHAVLVWPLRQARARWLGPAAWGLALLVAGLTLQWLPTASWWAAQGLLVGSGLAAAALLRRSPQRSPLADLLRRLILAATASLLLLDTALVAAAGAGLAQSPLADTAPLLWAVFAALLLLLPFPGPARPALRELALLAGVCSVVGSTDLLLGALFGLDPVLSLLLALALVLGLALALRRWLLDQLGGADRPSAERLFDSLYRVARELEQTPEQAGRQIAGLLREVFDPLEIARSARPVARAWVSGDGATLVLPLPTLPGQAAGSEPQGTVVLRLARRGRRLFTEQDLRLAERLLEQLRRAVAYDRAVEQGRTEERSRIAQDLHDDIGARLLTLMYRAADPEIEEYIRHTLQDLKTLTRGLAAANHRLSHAAAEWKADITGRLAATGCSLRWSFSADRDILLSVVQWSGLTRVLRELVNNILSHAQASQVEISVQFERGQLTLSVGDDGIGRAPETWSHGLGLGGVRKRVKLLGGQVRWQEQAGRGIRCALQAPLSGQAQAGDGAGPGGATSQGSAADLA